MAYQPKVGEWVFFDHKLVIVKEISESGVIVVSDGMLETSGLSLSKRMFPLTLRGLYLVRVYQHRRDNLNRLDGRPSRLNWPAISDEICRLWVAAMEAGDDESARNCSISETDMFFDEVESGLEKAMAFVTTSGIRIFR